MLQHGKTAFRTSTSGTLPISHIPKPCMPISPHSLSISSVSLERTSYPPLIEEWPITYTLHSTSLEFSQTPPTKLSPLTVLNLPEASTSPSVLGLPDGAAVIFANKFIGFGRAGTQEETHVGASPECCPAVLLTPPLKDNQELVITGAEPMITISGYGRDARCTEILSPFRESIHHEEWKQRTMFFMDALELDPFFSRRRFA